MVSDEEARLRTRPDIVAAIEESRRLVDAGFEGAEPPTRRDTEILHANPVLEQHMQEALRDPAKRIHRPLPPQR